METNKQGALSNRINKSLISGKVETVVSDMGPQADTGHAEGAYFQKVRPYVCYRVTVLLPDRANAIPYIIHQHETG